MTTVFFYQKINPDSSEQQSENDKELLKKTEIVNESKETSSRSVNSDLLSFRHGCSEEIMRNISRFFNTNHVIILVYNNY